MKENTYRISGGAAPSTHVQLPSDPYSLNYNHLREFICITKNDKIFITPNFPTRVYIYIEYINDFK